MSLLRFFQENFADPLEISYYQMNLSPTEDAYMGGGIRLRPRDFLKLGQVYLGGGVWKGKRLVSEDWVRQSATAHASLNRENDYGYGWWRQTFEVRGRSIDTFFASGNGGQMLFVIPELEMTVMIQAGNYSDGRTRNAFRDRFMGQLHPPRRHGRRGADASKRVGRRRALSRGRALRAVRAAAGPSLRRRRPAPPGWCRIARRRGRRAGLPRPRAGGAASCSPARSRD